MARFEIYDVFSEKPFGGNQLAVVLEAETLPGDKLQSIAREFNFSETTFVFPPSTEGVDADVRIFTPTNEIPFAGHPTIGTAIALARATGRVDLTLNLGVGPLPCEVSLSGRPSAAFVTVQPLERLGKVAPEDAAACLGLDPRDISTKVHPPEIASVGLPFTLVELASPKAMARAEAEISAFRLCEGRYGNDIDMFAIFFYRREGQTIDARMFAPLNNIPEDPATGSAAAALTAYLGRLEGCDQSFEITQGVVMGRPSFIRSKAILTPKGAMRVRIEGSAVPMMMGEFLF